MRFPVRHSRRTLLSLAEVQNAHRKQAQASRDAYRHGLLFNTVVRSGKTASAPSWLSSTPNTNPPPKPRLLLVEAMAAGRWLPLRVWGAQKPRSIRDMALQDPGLGPKAVQVLFTLRGSDATACPPELLLSLFIAFDRQLAWFRRPSSRR